MSAIQMESPAHMVTEILWSFEKCYRQTDRLTGADIELLRQLTNHVIPKHLSRY